MPADGLVAWYPFNCDANDLSANRNNATVYGAQLTTDRFGNANSAWHFNGISDHIIAHPIPALNFNNQLSISAWVKLDDYSLNSSGDPNRAIIGKQRSPDQTGFNMLAVEATLIYSFGMHDGVTNATDDAADTLSLKTWHHLVSVYDGATMYLYKDGTLVHTSSFSITLAPSSQPLCIGKEGAVKRYFKGSIDDVALWNRALTAAEVLRIYNGTGMISGKAELGAGKMITLAAAIPDGKWSSSSASIATVDENGKVTGVSAGRATIWYSVNSECGDNSVIARMSFRVSSSLNLSEEGPEKAVEKAPVAAPEKTWKKPDEIPSVVLPVIAPVKAPVVPPESATASPHGIPQVALAETAPEKIPVTPPVLMHVKKRRVASVMPVAPPAIPIVVIADETPVNAPEKKAEPKDAFSISVDPEREELTITTDAGAYTTVTIKDRTEKALVKQFIKGTRTIVDISKLQAGSYYVILEKDGRIKTTMFVKD